MSLKGHTTSVLALKQLPNGDLVSGSDDKTVRVWSLNDGSLKATLIGHTYIVYSLVVLPTGDLVSGSENEIIFWDLNNATNRTTLKHQNGRVLALLPNGDLASGKYDLKIWDVSNGTVRKELVSTNYTSFMISSAVLANGDLVTGSNQGEIKIWDVNNGTVRASIDGNKYISSLALRANGDLISGSYDSTIKIWRVV